jgi:hypothetical protein
MHCGLAVSGISNPGEVPEMSEMARRDPLAAIVLEREIQGFGSQLSAPSRQPARSATSIATPTGAEEKRASPSGYLSTTSCRRRPGRAP